MNVETVSGCFWPPVRLAASEAKKIAVSPGQQGPK
jgi:hypothetical protein